MIATSDWQRSVQNLIAPWVPGDYVALGADGFGFSDTRAAARRHFLIDGPSMVVATLAALERRGEYRKGAAAEAAAKYQLHDVRAGTSGNAGGDSLKREPIGSAMRCLSGRSHACAGRELADRGDTRWSEGQSGVGPWRAADRRALSSTGPAMAAISPHRIP